MRKAQSPMTPARLSRVQEKNVLASLNDRLAAYIERNQQLENENASVTKQLSKSEETMQRTVTRLRETYDKELVESRRVIDETAKDRARLDLENSQLRKDFQDTKDKLDKKTKEATSVAKALSQLDSRFQDLTAQNNKLGSERDNLLVERKDLADEVYSLQKGVESLRKQLEQETLLRSDLESQLKTKTEELSFKSRCHEQELTAIRTLRTQEIQEVDGRLQQEYDRKLQKSLQELRVEYEGALRSNKEELDGLYEQKVADIKAQLKRKENSSKSKADEVVSLTSRVEALTSSLARIESERNGLLTRIQELEAKLDADHKQFVILLSDRDLEMDRLVSEKSALLSDYQGLMDVKVQLDNEIGIFKKLLEDEEQRLSISPKKDQQEKVIQEDRQEKVLESTPSGGRPLVLKRKRLEQEEEEIDTSLRNFESRSICKGDVEILEDDVQGKFIRLKNNSDKEISVSGWQLIRLSGDIDTTHKFNRKAKIDAKGTLTVWSSDAIEGVHEPPANFQMKAHKWYTSDHFKTVLTDQAGEEQSIRETKRV